MRRNRILAALGGLLARPVAAQRIAVIGGGITGSFVTKYLTDYDRNCSLASITVFEPLPLDGPLPVTFPPDDDAQYSRVQSVRLGDGTVVELGASIAYRDFYLIKDMIQSDPDHLQVTEPFATGTADAVPLRDGMGVYNGRGDWSLLLTAPRAAGWRKRLALVWRYGWDLYRVAQLCRDSVHQFRRLPGLLESRAPDTFFASPDEVWSRLGLAGAVHTSFEQLLDAVGVSRQISYLRSLLPGQGNLRRELLDAINLVNYNQHNAEVNGMVGLGSFAAAGGGLFSLAGGNARLIGSALRQARAAVERHCRRDDAVRQVAVPVRTVVAGLDRFELFSADRDSLGSYEIVILAAPLHAARVQFLVQSHFDEAVLEPMPLGGAVDLYAPNGRTLAHPRPVHTGELPEYATRPFTQVTTTIVSNGSLNASLFRLTEAELPRAIVFTQEGKRSMHNITAITQIKASTGVYKVFSNDRLDIDVLNDMFGPHAKVEYVKLWGGPFGGATPQYRGDGMALPFVLYDGAAKLPGHTTAGVVYYPSAMEQSSMACMELSAVGARSVAKLVARRLGLIQEEIHREVSDEL